MSAEHAEGIRKSYQASKATGLLESTKPIVLGFVAC